MSPLIFTIFGATGDLTFRKLVPALFTLYTKNLLNSNFSIVGFARREWQDEDFRNHLDLNVDQSKFSEDEKYKWREFLTHIKFLSFNFDNPQGYNQLANLIEKIEKDYSANSIKIFYFSSSPEFFKIIAENIANSTLCNICTSSENARVVIEKPYGTDLQNSIEMDIILQKSFQEKHIYRIDHYLGKESIQNILVFRFANSIFEKLWNKDNIEYIQIKVDENLGVEERGGYYDQIGVVKDMVQNHILQTLALITMDAPTSSNSVDIQSKRIEILENISLYDDSEKNVILGQYEGYRSEKNVKIDSNTPTFVAIKLKINTPKWQEVPIYVRTGKKLQKKLSEISIKFKHNNNNFYSQLLTTQNDILTFRIQPDEGISLIMTSKQPGEKIKLTPVNWDFCYRPTFGQPFLDSYVGLLQNVIIADQSLFTSIEEVQSQWNFINKYNDIFNQFPYSYTSGLNGPDAGDILLKQDGYEWINNENYTCALR